MIRLFRPVRGAAAAIASLIVMAGMATLLLVVGLVTAAIAWPLRREIQAAPSGIRRT